MVKPLDFNVRNSDETFRLGEHSNGSCQFDACLASSS